MVLFLDSDSQSSNGIYSQLPEPRALLTPEKQTIVDHRVGSTSTATSSFHSLTKDTTTVTSALGMAQVHKRESKSGLTIRLLEYIFISTQIIGLSIERLKLTW